MVTIDDDNLISLDQLASMLRSWEGPPQTVTRTAPPRSRAGRLLAAGVAAAVLGVSGTLGALSLLDGTESTRSSTALRHVTLPPLPPGPLAIGLDASGGSALIGRVTLDEMIESAAVVFVGRVTDIGGVEPIDPGARFSMTAHRVRYQIERVLRGEPVDAIDITNLKIIDATFPAEVGKTYLVFAEWRELGEDHIRRLVPSGYWQGVYSLIAPDQAANEANGAVEINAIAERIRAAR